MSVGWLEPLLDRIATNQSNVVAPVIDVIDDKSMQYKFGNARATNVGGFDWNLQFNWHAIPARETSRRKSPVDPIRYVSVRSVLYSLWRWQERPGSNWHAIFTAAIAKGYHIYGPP